MQWIDLFFIMYHPFSAIARLVEPEGVLCTKTLTTPSYLTSQHVNEYINDPENNVSRSFLMVKKKFQGSKLTSLYGYEVLK